MINILIRRLVADKTTAVYSHTQKRTHTHTKEVLYVSSACQHQTPSNIKIFRAIKPYLPIISQRILVSLWITLPLKKDSLRSFKITISVY